MIKEEMQQLYMTSKCKLDWADLNDENEVIYSIFYTEDEKYSAVHLHYEGHIGRYRMDEIIKDGLIFSEDYGGVVSIYRTSAKGAVNITKDVVARSIHGAAASIAEHESNHNISIPELIASLPDWLFTNITRESFSDMVDNRIRGNDTEYHRWFDHQRDECTFTTMGG